MNIAEKWSLYNLEVMVIDIKIAANVCKKKEWQCAEGPIAKFLHKNGSIGWNNIHLSCVDVIE